MVIQEMGREYVAPETKDKPREFWIQWYPKCAPGPEDSIMYPAVCSQMFHSLSPGEMIHVREVTPADEAKDKLIDDLRKAWNSQTGVDVAILKLIGLPEGAPGE